MDWCREVLKEPGELMKVVCSPIIQAERGAAAASQLIKMLRTYEPSSFSVIRPDWVKMINNLESTVGGPWLSTALELEDRGSDNIKPKNTVDTKRVKEARDLYSEINSIRGVAKQMGASVNSVSKWIRIDLSQCEATNNHVTLGNPSSSSREGIRRRIKRALDTSDDPVVVAKAQEALNALLNGSSAIGALRIAGLKKDTQPEVRLRVKQDKAAVATQCRSQARGIARTR